ncbi:DUF5640 domain-containing protein [[Ruminococcus] lactaris]|jgi:predicted nucleic acid-binding Zn ribbon protein|uniref:DUF5640 domain-containing protein n=1 Tax=[Ruminococcus] lactaris TaxID=46228 RepID=UPI001D05248D|nr:DUF5640 domain-containing protein [[Ruminococcus] lactaris]MCB5444319.1 DUF5640 domain-containing protein [[Ruminococcus] lactaris]MCB5534471.1 DUF5640 domain-containing protein [[Ruminococcus] lactaris]
MQDYQSPRPGEHRQPGQYLSESERMAQRNKKKQKQRRMLFGGAAAVLIVIVVVIVLIVKGCSGRTDVLAGTWDFDGTTTYSFDGEGSGAMVLPSISYDFTYTIDGNKLVIDYINESVHDSPYEFAVDGDILTMVGGEGKVGGTYKLTRQE